MTGRIVLALLVTIEFGSAELRAKEPRFRRPVAVAVSRDGSLLYTANRDAGSVSVIDIEKRSVRREINVSGRPTAMALSADGTRLLLTDARDHRLILLSKHGDWKASAQLDVAAFPADVALTRDGRRCYVASLWSRMVSVIDLGPSDGAKAKLVKTIRLPFEPGRLCLTPEDRSLVVAGAFGGQLATVDATALKLTAINDTGGHNIGGLAVGADGRLLVAQQLLNPLARSTFNDVHWGNMLTNVVCSYSLKEVTNPRTDLLADRQVTHLGGPDNGAGDPGGIAVRGKRIAIALAGVGEVATAAHLDGEFARTPTGVRPTAVVFSADGKQILVADELADTISIIAAAQPKRVARIPLGRTVELTPAERGERLFFSARLSHDGWMSCHSCHTNGHANGRLNDNLSDGSFGAPKRVLSLLGVGDTGPWAWDGKTTTLERQVHNSITKTMQGASPSKRQVADLTAYIKTLKPPPSVAQFEPNAEVRIDAGRKLFAKLNCNRCHAAPTYTSPEAYDVGLKDAVGNTRFNPPSLRGVGRRTSLFHDSRAKSLKHVFVRERHRLPRALSPRELDDLIGFLMSL